MKMKKNVRLLLIPLILIIIGLLAFKIFGGKKNSNDEFELKNFLYNVPQSLNFIKETDDSFRIENANAYMIVEPYIDEDEQIYYHSEIYYKILRSRGLDVSEPELVTIDKAQIIKFNNAINNTAVCYFSLKSGYAYEVVIYNNDKTFNTDILEIGRAHV